MPKKEAQQADAGKGVLQRQCNGRVVVIEVVVEINEGV